MNINAKTYKRSFFASESTVKILHITPNVYKSEIQCNINIGVTYDYSFFISLLNSFLC